MRIMCVIAVVLLTACSTQPPQTATYLLRTEVGTTSGTPLADSGIALGNVRVATYIDQPGLVLAAGDGTITAARNHVWAEPLQVSLRRYLATQISSASGRDIAASATATTRSRIDVTVDQLHGDSSGAAVLVAYWEIAVEGATRAFRFSEQQSLAGDGYDALVRAEEALLQRLADAIAASLPADAAQSG
ncbi:MAG: ABC-type transport auxiliary lipoprotein family protein [Gammaproteobacteria bacterium]|jgi:uncharacterized lipoprotein YmbA|nr:ABC-type transport auxiliary lipoprotein family protein [Gammaproteobacteria bacterium]